MTKNNALRIIVLLFCVIAISYATNAQCCAGGGGSPIAGGASQGVLLENQIDISTNFQFINTNTFYEKDLKAHDATRTFDSFSSTYEYFRVAYGLTKNFTFSVESGYYLNKKEVGLNHNPETTYESKGIGDLILFSRYDIINRTEEKHRTEATVGLGFKIPLGSYNDSTGYIEPFSGQTYYVTKPTAVQLSSGAQDLIFYTFLYRGWTEHNFRVFANLFYIKKGYNPNGEKAGDYASVALFAGKSFFDHLGITLQARYEWTDIMKINENTLLYGKPSNYYPEATGYKKIFITPQISFTKGKFTIYAASDFPVYQYLNTSEYYTQVGSQHQYTVGVSYKFLPQRKIIKEIKGTGKYSCPMHPEEISDNKARCSKCGMDLEKAK